MSGVIPMVSASPPPFEEEGGDDWGEDFGNFMGADHNVSADYSTTENWAAFPESESMSNDKPTSQSNLSQESEILQENVPSAAMELRLDSKGSNLISSSDSGLDLGVINGSESVSPDRQGAEPHIDSGLSSSAVSPCDPSKTSQTCSGTELQSSSTSTASDSPEDLTEFSNTNSNMEKVEDSEVEFCDGSYENPEIIIYSDQSRQCLESPETDCKADSEKLDDSDTKAPVQDSSVSQCEDNVQEDSSFIDLKTDDSSRTIHVDDNDDWGDFGDDVMNSSNTSGVGDQTNKKSQSSPDGDTEEMSNEDREDSLSNSAMETCDLDLDKSMEEKPEENEKSEQETDSVKDGDDTSVDALSDSGKSMDKDGTVVADDTETNDDFGNFMAPKTEGTDELSKEDDEEPDNQSQHDCQIESTSDNESGNINKDVTSDDQKENENIQSKTSDAGHEASDDDFDDFADFDSVPVSDVEVSKDGHFPAFSDDNAVDSGGNWAAFQDTSNDAVARDDDWAGPQDQWADGQGGEQWTEGQGGEKWTDGQEGEQWTDGQGGEQWTDGQGGEKWEDGEEDEWQKGGEADFGDFGDFDEKPVVAAQNEKLDELSNKTLATCFHDDVRDEDSLAEVSALDNYIQNQEPTASQNKPSGLWKLLTKQVSESPLKWSKSRSHNQLYSSLRIDTRNILIGHKKSSVPIYASNLTLLEPVKGPAQPTMIEPALVDTDKEEPQKQDIPPVQFDWSSSGLVNPLQGDTSKSLDLDFLVVQETESGGRSGVFDSELMHGQKPNLQPLENILANLKVSTVKKTRQADKLGDEASRIIQSLPDLSFMQAKVLMFPIRHQE